MLNNKVILQIVPALNNGGVERGVIETSKFLVKNNNKSIVISSGGRNFIQIRCSFKESFKMEKIKN